MKVLASKKSSSNLNSLHSNKSYHSSSDGECTSSMAASLEIDSDIEDRMNNLAFISNMKKSIYVRKIEQK